MADNKEVINKIKNIIDSTPKEELFGREPKDYKDFKGYDCSQLLSLWKSYIDNSEEAENKDYDWHESTLPEIKAIRLNKEHPYTVDLAFDNGKIYYACYPVGVKSNENENEPGILNCTINFEGLDSLLEDYDVEIE